MSKNHSLYKFSITCKAEDVIVLFCLRAICQFFAGGPAPQIGWGGSGRADWEKAGSKATFRFVHPNLRDKFIAEANRLFPNLWVPVSESDNDPAQPQR